MARPVASTGQHLAEDRGIRKQFRALSRDCFQTAEGRQRLGKPPVGRRLQRRFEFKPVGGIGRGRLERHLRAERRGHAGLADNCSQRLPLLLAAERFVDQPFHDALSAAGMARLGGSLHEGLGRPQQIPGRLGGRVFRGEFTGLIAGLVEERHGLLHPPDQRLGHGGLAQRHGIVWAGFQERHAARGSLGEFLGGQLKPGAVRHQAGPSGMPLRQPLHFRQSCRVLLPVGESVDLFQIAHEFGAAELDLLAGATRARRIRVQGHVGVISGKRPFQCELAMYHHHPRRASCRPPTEPSYSAGSRRRQCRRGQAADGAVKRSDTGLSLPAMSARAIPCSNPAS